MSKFSLLERASNMAAGPSPMSLLRDIVSEYVNVLSYGHDDALTSIAIPRDVLERAKIAIGIADGELSAEAWPK